jgi:ABC-type phosphate transport system substrate-binding protein
MVMASSRRQLLTFVLALAMAASPASAGADPAPLAFPVRVIVNANNPVSRVDRKFLLEAFLGKITRWSDNQLIRPADQRPDSVIRRRFSDEALRRSVAAVKSYWLQVVFSGHGVPPPEFETDADVVNFVRRTPGAVGYVSGGANVDGTRVVEVN